jgi:hypothetical protein
MGTPWEHIVVDNSLDFKISSDTNLYNKSVKYLFLKLKTTLAGIN